MTPRQKVPSLAQSALLEDALQDRALKLLFVIGGCIAVVSAVGILAAPLIVHLLGGPVSAG